MQLGAIHTEKLHTEPGTDFAGGSCIPLLLPDLMYLICMTERLLDQYIALELMSDRKVNIPAMKVYHTAGKHEERLKQTRLSSRALKAADSVC